MINSIHDGAIVLKPRELQEPYDRATVRAAHSFYVKQFDRYIRTKDLRKMTREMMPCGDYRKSGLWDHCFLSMKFADIDLDFLSSDVIGQVQRDFEEMVRQHVQRHILTLAIRFSVLDLQTYISIDLAYITKCICLFRDVKTI